MIDLFLKIQANVQSNWYCLDTEVRANLVFALPDNENKNRFSRGTRTPILSREKQTKIIMQNPKNALPDGRTQGSPLRLDTAFCNPTVGAGFMPALTCQSPSRNALQNAGIPETALMFSTPATSQMPMRI
jgi:hypothetical protein